MSPIRKLIAVATRTAGSSGPGCPRRDHRRPPIRPRQIRLSGNVTPFAALVRKVVPATGDATERVCGAHRWPFWWPWSRNISAFPCFRRSHKQERRPGRKPRAALGGLDRALLRDAVGSLPGGVLRGFDLLSALAAEDADEASNGVVLPARGVHGVDKQRHLERRVSQYVST